MATIEVKNLGTFDVNVWSAGTGSPVVFLHGYERHPGGASFLQKLAETHTVYAPEQPGYGSSTGFEHIQDIADLALFYRKYIESLGVSKVDLIGHSSGGMVAAEVAALSPHLVNKLVLVDSFGVWLDDEPAQDPFGDAAKVKAAKWFGEVPKPEPTIFVPDPNDPAAEVFFSAQNLSTATKFLWPIADRGLSRRLPYIEAPTLVINGAADGLVPVSHAREFVRLLPTAELAVIDDAAHYPMIEQEDEFVRTVSDFLSA
jgi:pimeloyl-ACP methyl ester carboxylesterase